MAKDPDQLPQDGEEKEPSRFQSAASRVVRWLIFGLLIFVIGFVTIWLTYVGPRAAEISALHTQQAASQTQVATLELALEELQAIEVERNIYDILVDVNSARYELASDRLQGAEAALAATPAKFSRLRLQLGADYSTLISEMQRRLTLALTGVDQGDEFAALNDLGVLENSLLRLLSSFSN